MIVHDHNIRIKFLAHLPALIQRINISAVAVGTHHHPLICHCHIRQRLFFIPDMIKMITQHTFHIDQSADSPRMFCPGRKMCIIMCRTAPYDRTVFIISSVCFPVLFISFEHHLCHFFILFCHKRIQTGRSLEFIFPLQGQRTSYHLRIWGTVYIPFIQHTLRCLIIFLCLFPECIPVPFHMVSFFNKTDTVFQIFYCISIRLRFIKPLRRGQRKARQFFHIAIHKQSRAERSVTRHRTCDKRTSHLRIVIHNRTSNLCGWKRTHISCKPHTLCCIYVHNICILVHLSRQADR